MATRADCLEQAFMAEWLMFLTVWLHAVGVLPVWVSFAFSFSAAFGFGSWLALWRNGLSEYPPNL
jgi:hypothetical protein